MEGRPFSFSPFPFPSSLFPTDLTLIHHHHACICQSRDQRIPSFAELSCSPESRQQKQTLQNLQGFDILPIIFRVLAAVAVAIVNCQLQWVGLGWVGLVSIVSGGFKS